MIFRAIYSVLFISTIVFNSLGQKLDIQENVFLHTNNSLLLTGETLYFSAYTKSKTTGKNTSVSQILYVELIDQNKNPIFQQKIQLENGRGSGEFFIPSLLSTGTYQLIAYTRWMKNFENYFHQTLSIVNPFEEVQNAEVQTETKIAFYPEGGTLVTGTENFVLLHAMKGDKPLPIKGQIASLDGDKISDIQTDKFGFAEFSITPLADKQYQAILEDENGDFQFIKLPSATKDGIAIHIETIGTTTRITAKSTESRVLNLQINDGQNEVLNEQINTNSPFVIRGNTLLSATLIAYIYDDTDDLLASRIFTTLNFDRDISRISEVYKPATSVDIPLDIPEGSNVSVSVRKVEKYDPATNNTLKSRLSTNLNKPFTITEGMDKKDIDHWLQIAEWNGGKNPESITYLPESRGEIITGRVSSDTDLTGKIASYTMVGDDFQIYTDELNENGEFTIQIESSTSNRNAIVTIVDEESNEYAIEIEDAFLTNYPEFQTASIMLDSASIQQLVDRSIRNQIENIYYQQNKTALIPAEFYSAFGDYDYSYELDEFTRFADMYEHFIEFIPMVLARNNKTRTEIKVYLETPMPDSYNPLILLDGVPVSQSDILNFSPYRIKEIGVVNNRFFLGDLVSDGVVSFHTFNEDLQGFELGKNTLETEYQGVESLMNYSVSPGIDSLSNIPDYRDQLYWNPIMIANKNFSIEVNTSQTTGEFKVSIEGYTKEGKPLSVERFFTVDDQTNSSN